MQEDTLTPFKELFNSNIAILMRKLNKQTCPLSVAGHLLNYVGNHILYYVYMSTQKKIYYPKHQALSVQLMGNGDVVTQVLKTEFTMTVDNSVTPPVYNMKEGKQSVVYFRSKAILIGAGASQGFHPALHEWFPDLSPDKLIASDTFLQKQGYIERIEKLRALNRRPKIVIIGGSHSGFSCAWMLLHGPAMYNRCEIPNEEAGMECTRPTRVPFAVRKGIKNCVTCCSCGYAVNVKAAAVANLIKEDMKQVDK